MKFWIAIVGLGTVGCAADDPANRTTTSTTDWVLSVAPAARLDQAEPVLALELTGPAELTPPSDLALVEGEPSEVSAKKYTTGETTAVLAERIVPTLGEQSVGKVVLRPRYALAVGQRYTLISRSGVLGVVTISPQLERQYLTRVWPPRDSVEATGQVLYCGDAAPSDASAVTLFPGGVRARLEPGFDAAGSGAGNCLRIQPETASGGEAQPPLLVADFALEPVPFRVGVDLAELTIPNCLAPARTLGPGCLRIDNGNATVQGPSGTTYWVLRSADGWHSTVDEGGGRFVVPLAQSNAPQRLDAWVFDLAGRSLVDAIEIAPILPSPHVAINEVMANPLGSEPGDEWIELVNAGTAAATMVGWKLRDQGGEVELPALLLEPGAFALLVRSDFVGGQAGDIPPVAGTTLIRMTAIAKNGLTNSGEALALIDAAGTVVSATPGRSIGQEGVSLARRTPTELDGSAEGFGPHASPGASPGAANVVE